MIKYPTPMLIALVSVFALVFSNEASCDSFLDTLLKITGISATPSQQRGDNEALAGNIWIAKLDHKIPSQITQGGRYRSPVFLPDDSALLALQDERLMRVVLPGGQTERLYELRRVIKLVGFSKADPEQLLILLDGDAEPQPALLSLQDGRIHTFTYNVSDPAHRRMLDHISGSERVYGDKAVYARQATERVPGGRYQVSTNIYFKQKDEELNLSHCKEGVCGQPSLSHDARRVVFIKSGT